MLLIGTLCAQDKKTDTWRDDLDYVVQRIEIMHPDPYAFCPREEFYKSKEELYNKIPDLSEVEIVISISELLALLNDGHTRWAFEKSDPRWLNQTFHLLPIILYPFEDGTFIMASIPQYKELVGSKVIQIGKMPIAEVQTKLGKIWSHDNKYGEKKFLYYTLGIAEMLKKIGAIPDFSPDFSENIGNIELILQNEKHEDVITQVATVPFMSMAKFFAGAWYPLGDSGLITINETAKNPLPLWLKNTDKSFWFEYVPEEKMMFLQINSLNFPHSKTEESPFNLLCAQFFEALDQSAAEKLVIDIRANNGGNHVELPLLKGIIARPHIDRQDKLFLITGRVTYSAAVHFATVFRRYTNITIIGEPASGCPNHYGAVRSFQLPNHPYVQFNCSIDYYQDSEPCDFNIINVPDIEKKITVADYQNNIDPVIESVKDYNKIINFVKYISRGT